MDWGTVPAWVGAVGSVLVALVIGGGLLYEIHQRRLVDARAEAQRFERLAAHARLVSVGGGIAKGRSGRISIRNDGDGPIRNLSYRLLVPGADGEQRVPVQPLKHHPPYLGGHDDLRVDIKATRLVDPRQSVVELEFTDTGGLRWALTSRNELRQVHYERADGP